MEHRAHYHHSNSWSAGAQGMLNVVVGEHIKDGWEVVLTFSSRVEVLDAHNAGSATPMAGNTVWVVKNASHNQEVWPSELNIEIVYQFTGTMPELLTATFMGVEATIDR